MLVLYGLGTTIGAGIYALTGAVAGRSGTAAPASFVLAAGLAGLTCLGFAELVGRYPRAAGAAAFVDEAFGTRRLTLLVGLGVLSAGLVAAATITVAFGGYVAELVDVPEPVPELGLVVVLAAIAAVGVRESVVSAGLVTVVELGGLALVVWSARSVWTDVPARLPELVGLEGVGRAGVVGGAFLAYFAFQGFEDMASVAEEAIDARRTLPTAILTVLALTTVLYVVVTTTAVLTVAPETLADSDAPLALVHETSGGRPGLLAGIAAVAMVNGVLVLLVMASRMVYGLTRLGLLPEAAGRVATRTGTPLRATAGAAALVAMLATAFDLTPLARITSGITLAVFVVVNVALVVIKRREGPTTTFQVPGWLPWLGTVASVAMFVVEMT